MGDREIKNAVIESTRLGYKDRGMLSAWIYLKYDGGGQGFGGYSLDGVGTAPKYERTPSLAAGIFIKGVLKALGVDDWEELPGTPIRVDAEHTRVHGIGHYLKDDWFYPEEEFKILREETLDEQVERRR